MTSHWDEFSKSLVEESVSRRESLRRIGLIFAGAVLSPLGLGTALARGSDPCKSFCRCRSKSQQNACLAACNSCNKDTSRLCGTCGTYVCCREPGAWEYGACINGHCEYACAEGAAYCDGICTFLGDDPDNCGACGNVCGEPGPYEYGACINGGCEYACAEGAVYCNGFCTFLAWNVARPGEAGYTSGQSVLLDNEDSLADARVDFVFVRDASGPGRGRSRRPDIDVLDAEVVGNLPADISESVRWASDHFGVVARLRLPP